MTQQGPGEAAAAARGPPRTAGSSSAAFAGVHSPPRPPDQASRARRFTNTGRRPGWPASCPAAAAASSRGGSGSSAGGGGHRCAADGSRAASRCASGDAARRGGRRGRCPSRGPAPRPGGPQPWPSGRHAADGARRRLFRAPPRHARPAFLLPRAAAGRWRHGGRRRDRRVGAPPQQPSRQPRRGRRRRGRQEALQLQELALPQAVSCLLGAAPMRALHLHVAARRHTITPRLPAGVSPRPAPPSPARSYCECFASGRYCDGCNCLNCYNNREHEATRQAAVEAILERNPNAFRPKIAGGVRL